MCGGSESVFGWGLLAKVEKFEDLGQFVEIIYEILECCRIKSRFKFRK